MQFVATDLDGTIVRPDLTVSARTVEALRACERAGIPVAIVTGRPPRWLPDAITATGIRGLAICANGAAVYDCATHELHQSWTIPTDVVLRTVDTLRQHLPEVSVALETTTGYLREPGYRAVHNDDDHRLRATLPELLERAGDSVIKVLIRAGGRGDDLLRIARSQVGELVEATHSNAADNLLELGPSGVSKAVTLAYLVERLGFAAADVIAFGDQPNDIPMLRWAGEGVAMADGHPAALRAADLVAPACADDGVAQILEARLAS